MGKGSRPRYNDKARGAKKGATNKGNEEGTNQYVIEKSEVNEVISSDQQPVRISKARQKRLDKYIQKKLKKEERIHLFEKLSKSSVSSNIIKSSKHLGYGKETLKEKLKRALVEERAGIPRSNPDIKLYEDTEIDSNSLKPILGGALKAKEEARLTPIKINDQQKNEPEKMIIQNESLINKIKESSSAQENPPEDNKKKIETSLAPSLSNKKSIYVYIERSEEIQAARLLLPVVMEEQTIMESVNENLITIVCGETGSGKTTQIPQFLYEYGYANRGLIGITQPRRVAAISMASRISQEMNNDKLVSYQVRYENNLNAMTKIKFMTDGVLFKEISQDFLLKSYSVLIIDEAHERSLNTDIVIGLLSRIVKLRSTLSSQDENIYPLKLIVMSATLRIDDFVGPSSSNLFSPIPPVINVETRQFPVTVHFNRITNQNYVEEAFKKTVKIHTKLTQGGILIFLTGQNEINHLALKLRERFKCTSSFSVDKYDIDNCYISDNEDSIDDDPISDFEYQENELLESQSSMPLHILPLYSLLPTAEQMKVFQDPPPGSRLCVIATNVAETSITIPGIKYVIDSGKVKEKNYKFDSKLSSFDISWISKSSADQRKGRAGRNGPGHCYRLFSSAVFDHEFPQFSKPEIKRLPIESVYLELKSINIDNVLNFPFPSPPEKAQLREAEKLLIKLGALTEHDKRITSSGRKMAELPIAPRMARIVLKSLESNCVEYGICLAAALTVGDPFCRENVDGDKERTFQKTQRIFSSDIESDMLMLVKVIGAYGYAKDKHEYCSRNFLRQKAMTEIQKLRKQLSRCLNVPFIEIIKPFNGNQILLLQQCIMLGYIDQIGVRDERTNSYRLMGEGNENEAYIHPSSCLFSKSPKYVVFGELLKTTKVYMKNLTMIPDALKMHFQ